MDLEQLKREWKNPSAHNGVLQAKIWDNRAGEYEKKEIPNEKDDPFLKFLWKKAEPDADMQVLDIGCGAGLYTIALAGRVKKAVGLDVSSRMIESAKRRADDLGIANAEFGVQDWSKTDAQRCGFQNGFDIVFAHMTPAVCDYHTFDQMNACSKKYCFMAKPVRRRDAVQDGAFAAVGIDTQGKQMDDTVLNSFTYLWLKGYTPEVVKIDEVWSAKRSVEEMTAWCTDRTGVYKNLTAEEKNRIRNYLESVSEEGMVNEVVRTSIVTIYWHV